MSRFTDAYEAVAVADAEIKDPDRPGHSALTNEQRVEALGLDTDEFLNVASMMAHVAPRRAPGLPHVELFLLGLEIGCELMRQEWDEATRGDR